MLSHLGYGVDSAPPEARSRVFDYYLPVYGWIWDQLRDHRRAGGSGPLIVGISAPQGCGKTTLCEVLGIAFDSQGLSMVGVSIDDFYLPHDQLLQVGLDHPGNRLLRQRGNALTHDLELGTATLRALRAMTDATSRAAVPRYDKSAYAGRGDRMPESDWLTVQGVVDVVLFEGWMLGFDPVTPKQAHAMDPDLGPINAALQQYRTAWDSYVDAWLVIRVADPGYAAAWRLEAERKQRAAGRPGMTDDQVADFVSCYMPAYRAYLPGLYSVGPTTAKEGHLLVIQVDETRRPTSHLPPLPALDGLGS